MTTDSTLRSVIDCDLHITVPSVDVLVPYLPRYWREYIGQSSFKGPIDSPHPPGMATNLHPDFRRGGVADTLDLKHLQQHALDPWQTEIGIVSCAYAVESLHNPEAAAALAAAVNEWQIAEWLTPEPRLRGSLVVPSQFPELAAREIERLGSHPSFVQVYLPVRSAAPYGNRRYHPIYSAAVRHDLTLGIHFGGLSGTAPTPTGWPSYYAEEYAGMAQIFQSQVLSLIAEGVFDYFPGLRVTLLESGFTWLPSLMWRLDKEWKGLRREIPWVKRPPSEIIRQHFRLTLQPLDAPPTPEHLRQVLEQMQSETMLMFSTDYPHWHFGARAEAVPGPLPELFERKLMSENARAFYRLAAKEPQ